MFLNIVFHIWGKMLTRKLKLINRTIISEQFVSGKTINHKLITGWVAAMTVSGCEFVDIWCLYWIVSDPITTIHIRSSFKMDYGRTSFNSHSKLMYTLFSTLFYFCMELSAPQTNKTKSLFMRSRLFHWTLSTTA